eukprot:jgi/Botrbrau1/16464/Bobra.0142s0059.1
MKLCCGRLNTRRPSLNLENCQAWTCPSPARNPSHFLQCRLSLRRLAQKSSKTVSDGYMLRALQENNGRQGGLDPNLEMAVPKEQRPVNELEQLRSGQLYSWATLDLNGYLFRLSLVWGGFFLLIGGPIAYQTFDPFDQPLEFVLSSNVGALLVVLVAILRIYLGWQYVGDRLLSAAIAYEETGWYDGQTFVKPPEVLTRDRLLGMYEVKPILARLKVTLLAAGSTLMATAAALAVLISAGADSDGVYGRGAARAPRLVTSEGIIYSERVRSLADLKDDDEAAAAEAEAQGGVPGYCGDRLYRAAAGGHFCTKFDYQKAVREQPGPRS